MLIAGVGIIAVGGYHIYKGACRRGSRGLQVSGGQAVTALGSPGYTTPKGSVLGGAGLLLIVATLTADPSKGRRTGCRGEDPGPPRRSAGFC